MTAVGVSGLLQCGQAQPSTSERNIRLGAMMLWKPTDAPAVPTIVVGSQAWLDSRFHDTWPPYTFAAMRWEN